ncbi:hypothetical protein HYQ46_010679 [Verticillium longisporum]|nr:hypothetical protein HYQ46_010679 [Verticillium longisporum]
MPPSTPLSTPFLRKLNPHNLGADQELEHIVGPVRHWAWCRRIWKVQVVVLLELVACLHLSVQYGHSRNLRQRLWMLRQMAKELFLGDKGCGVTVSHGSWSSCAT